MTTLTEIETPVEEATPGRPPARYGLLALTLAIVVGLVLGYLAGLLTPHLTRPGDDSPEAGFARDMSTHHAQAVEMGLIAYRASDNPKVRQIAIDIATNQQGEIGMMQAWLRRWKLDPTGAQPAMAWMPNGRDMVKDGLMPGMATPEEMDRLRQARGKEGDILFAEMMIKHHIGGIHMVDAILARTDDEEVREAARRMKENQQTEINILRQLLDEVKAS